MLRERENIEIYYRLKEHFCYKFIRKLNGLKLEDNGAMLLLYNK